MDLSNVAHDEFVFVSPVRGKGVVTWMYEINYDRARTH